MQFETLAEFVQMGGYGAFVFSVYIITAVVLIGNVILPLQQKRRFFADKVERQKRAEQEQRQKRV
ncbi:MAG: heme exporter protein D [Candidatus Azotimanducaceae bacterium]|jgi:heme exporter protein D